MLQNVCGADQWKVTNIPIPDDHKGISSGGEKKDI